ncbi:MAG TPA: hypothetical protein VFG43_16390 [Geminicoccaceae bacterium]|nr:hypothetical protein [Geminicoccaceae bacterium]
MEWLLGNDLRVFLGLTVVLFGGAAFIMGQALAESWRPAWQNVTYGLLMGVADRFLSYALFGESLLSIPGYLASVVVIVSIALLAYRLARTRRMVSQYPWIYERAGPFNWRERAGSQ